LSARRQVTQDEAKKYAEEEGLMWGETSAKSGEGVSDIFTAIGANFHNFPRRIDHSCQPIYISARKLPQTAPPKAGGAVRSGAAASRAGVDLNKQSNVLGGQNEACNC